MTGSGSRLTALIGQGDLDGLVRLVGDLCAAGDWEGLVLLRDRSRAALERGLQLWPAAEYAEYRLALEAPGPYAGPVVVAGAGRFALGPLWEVAASTHCWEELAPHLPAGPARALAAGERVVRGEDLTSDGSVDPGVLDLPLVLQPWERGYAPAVFRPDGADFPSPARPALQPGVLPRAGPSVEDETALEAWRDLARPWAEQSNGRVEVCLVEGSAEAAVAALGWREVPAAEVDAAAGLAWLAWAAASGGAYGRRRGTAAGRAAAWWAVAALADLEWPAEAERLGEALRAMRWLAWEPPDFAQGWGLHLAVELGEEGLALAVAAHDARREEPVAGSEAGERSQKLSR
ncbi:MAG: hypothetical protein FJW79_08330 [Actinobacteria bacterium]|nr:hypothetical protein [Actinomycetota bacterium]